MNIFVAGGHGKIGLRLLRLAAQRGDQARGLIRDPGQSADLAAVGAEPAVADWEAGDEITPLVAGTDAVVFAAGAGPGSGPERKRTVDYGGAVKLIEAAKANGVSRYAIVSSMGADAPERAPEAMRPYQEAKAAADEALRDSGLDFTIVRPGMLTDDPGTGLVDAAPTLGRRGSIPRDDVAAVLLAVLDEPSAIGKTFDVLSGDVPIEQAVRKLPPDPG
jgi:uncharacterized protein YbjT (DUF2867 family)